MITVPPPDALAAVQIALQCVTGAGGGFAFVLGMVGAWAIVLRVMEAFYDATT